MPENLRETEHLGAVHEAGTQPTGRTITVDLITPGWGSSGYYSPQVLEQAARDRIFPAGTHMYLDHPTVSEDAERPERSVRDLAAVTTSDAAWNPQRQALEAQARVFGPFQQPLNDMREAIGVSIRAAGEIDHGEAEGRTGRIITRLSHGTSADFVTRAGRGGRITGLLESARSNLAEARNVGQWMESRLHQDFTNRADDMAAHGHLTRDERIHLSNAVGQGLSAFASHLEEHAPQLYQRDIYDEPAAPAVSEGAPAPTTPTEENLMPQIEEARLSQLEEAAGRVPTLESERDAAVQRATAAETALAEHRARQAARPAVAAQVAESQVLGARSQARIVESVLAALPVVDGAIADDARTAAVTAAVEAAEAEAAEYGRPVREGVVGAFGSKQGGKEPSDTVSEADIKAYDAASARTFGRTITGV